MSWGVLQLPACCPKLCCGEQGRAQCQRPRGSRGAVRAEAWLQREGISVRASLSSSSSEKGNLCLPRQVLPLRVLLHALALAVMLHNAFICVWIFRNSSLWLSCRVPSACVWYLYRNAHVFRVPPRRCAAVWAARGGWRRLGLPFISAYALGF